MSTQTTLEWFLLRQKAFLRDEITLLSNSIPRDFAEAISCLRDITKDSTLRRFLWFSTVLFSYKIVHISIKFFFVFVFSVGESRRICVIIRITHSIKKIRIWSFSGPYIPAFWLNTEIYGVNIRIQSDYGNIRTRKTPNTDTFHAVIIGV